eukprot:PhM_4_TR2956/c0_g1_i1/m.50469
MLQRTFPRRTFFGSFWDTPLSEQIPALKMYRLFAPGNLNQVGAPRTLHGSYETNHPATSAIVRYYPYRYEMSVNNEPILTVNDMLKRHYFPMPMKDEDRINYVARKTGQNVEAVAKRMYDMRFLRHVCAQEFRNGVMGRGRHAKGSFGWDDKKYLAQTLMAAAAINRSMFFTTEFNPWMIYSPKYKLGGVIDCVANRQYRSELWYVLCDVVLDDVIPRARLFDVKEGCKGPIAHLEPSVWNFLLVRQSILAYLLRKEHYVVDTLADGGPDGHKYCGCIAQIHRTPDMKDVTFDLHSPEIDPDLGRRVLQHYAENHLGEMGRTIEVGGSKGANTEFTQEARGRAPPA